MSDIVTHHSQIPPLPLLYNELSKMMKFVVLKYYLYLKLNRVPNKIWGSTFDYFYFTFTYDMTVTFFICYHKDEVK